MKNKIFSILIIAIVFTACNSEKKEAAAAAAVTNTETTHDHNDPNHKHSDAAHDESAQPTIETATTTDQIGFSIDEIVDKYLEMKNALTKEDAKTAAAAGREMITAMGKLNPNSLSTAQKQVYNDVADDMKEHAEHIGDNAGKIDHQREHFAMLSKDIYDLIKTFGAGRTVYQDFCPMYNDNKGAIWISETKEIKNPYYGDKMLSCGSMEKQL